LGFLKASQMKKYSAFPIPFFSHIGIPQIPSEILKDDKGKKEKKLLLSKRNSLHT
jgi:hypothetical protein